MLFSKKIRTLIFLLFFCTILAFALFLPLEANVTQAVRVPLNSDALFRQLLQDTTWHKWWPGESLHIKSKSSYSLNDIEFSVHEARLNYIILATESGSISFYSDLYITPTNTHDLTLTLTTHIPLSYNPIERAKGLLASSRVKKAYKKILDSLSHHFSTIKNLYGLDIKELAVPFEYITTSSQDIDHKPTVLEIYTMVDRVKSYIKKNGGEELGYPMLNSGRLNEKQFFLQIGIPTNKKMPDTKTITSKWMLRGGNIICTQVVGGSKVISNAQKQIEYYIQDNQRSQIAIPYEYLITNRLEQPDSSKWITQLYFPVI